MKNLQFTCEIPVNDDYEVLVIGGGPAGCTAAAAAGMEGKKTLLVEATGALGGMGTSGLVPAWCPFTDKEKIIYRGLAEKVLKASNRKTYKVEEDAANWVPIDPEALKVIYDEMVTEAGVKVLFNTVLSAVETENGKVTSAVLSSKKGLTAYSADVFIDCTGDADLAAWAGAEFLKGDETGELQPATHCFALGGVDEEAYLSGTHLHAMNSESAIYDILKSGRYPLIPDSHVCNSLVGPGIVGFNAGHIWDVDNTDPESVSEALMLGRKMAEQFRDALAEFSPEAFRNSYVCKTGALMGIRETRRIVGDYVLTADDYTERKTFPDEICRNCYFIDIHTSKEEKIQAREGVEHVLKRHSRYEPGESHGVPYRCLVPKGLENVLVAGRSISCDRTVQGSVRVMPVCLAMGEAAGTAAAFATQNSGNDIRKIDVEKLRSRLREKGAWLPEYEGSEKLSV